MQPTLGYLDEGGASGGQAVGPCLCGCRKRRWLPFWRNSSRAQATITTKMKKDKTFGKFLFFCFTLRCLPRHVSEKTKCFGSALSLTVADNQTPARLAGTLARSWAVNGTPASSPANYSKVPISYIVVSKYCSLDELTVSGKAIESTSQVSLLFERLLVHVMTTP